jgi:acyl-CoA reductase-like NAD-dependent aldehyde dehydrogenase
MEGNNLINGQWIKGAARRDVRNPARPGELLGSIALSDSAAVDDAVSSARAAFAGWRKLGAVNRGNLLFRAADILERSADELAELASREMGKPIGETRGEALRAVAILRYYAGEGLRPVGDVIPAANAQTLQYTMREPLGVVAIITPWNFPLAIPMWKLAPALVYGNTIVLKPAEWASLTAVRLIELLADIFPPGVLNLVLGIGSDAGEALVQHGGIDAISFTGSAGVGAHIAEIATRRNIKYQTEMGGKNPVIVAADANLGLAVETVVSGAMRSAGQKCTATSRVIVQKEVHAEFRDRLAERLTQLKVGDPLDPESYLGPVVSFSQRDKIVGYIEAGVREGAALIVGGAAPPDELKDGAFVVPTLFDNVSAGAAIFQEEIFGPVVGMTAADNVEHAIFLANQVRYGLSASVFTQNIHTALTFVDAIQAGMVRVNEETAGVELQAPFGGLKASSSHSREQGRAAMEFYTHVKTVAIRP